MRETLAQVDGKRFVAGIVLHDDRVVEAAPVVRYMKGWKRDSVRSYCRERGWKVSVVHEIERPK